MRRGAFAFILGLAAPAVLACDPGEWSFAIPPGDAGPPDARYEAACTTWARGYCAVAEACPGYYTAWEPGQCVSRMTLDCQLVASDPDVSFDPDAAASCPEPDGGDCSVRGGFLCLGPGRAGLGAPCFENEACASGACDFAYSQGEPLVCGVCIRRPCDGGCPNGQVCEPSVDAGSSCLAVAAVGQPCKSPSDCATFYCTPLGVCGARASTGEACSNEDKGPPCGTPLDFCDHTGHCKAPLYADYGAPCSSTGDDIVYCRGLGECDPANEVCIPPAEDGAFCDPSQALNCVPPAQCDNHTCVFESPASCSAE